MTKRRHTIELVLIYIILWLKGLWFNQPSLPWDNNLIILAAYAIDILLILFFIKRIDHQPLSRIGLKRISWLDLLGGFVLGLVLYLVQMLPPILFMQMDIRQFVEPPQWFPFFLRFLFLMITVGLGEELVFRGFFLYKLERIFHHKTVVVLLNALLFYIIHLTKGFVFDWTHVYSTFATTIVLSIYFYRSKKRSIFPLIVAHAMLDLLLGASGFYFLNLLRNFFNTLY